MKRRIATFTLLALMYVASGCGTIHINSHTTIGSSYDLRLHVWDAYQEANVNDAIVNVDTEPPVRVSTNGLGLTPMIATVRGANRVKARVEFTDILGRPQSTGWFWIDLRHGDTLKEVRVSRKPVF